MSEALPATYDAGATIDAVNTSRALAITGLGDDETTAGMGVTVIDKDQKLIHLTQHVSQDR